MRELPKDIFRISDQGRLGETGGDPPCEGTTKGAANVQKSFLPKSLAATLFCDIPTTFIIIYTYLIRV